MKKRIAALAILFAACLPGEAVGTVDPMKPSSLDVELAAGDKLRFRVDAECDVGDSKLPRRVAIEYLQRSQLSVTVKDAGGATKASCPLRGNGKMEGMSGSKLFTQGLVVSCELPAARAGKHEVSATIEWDPACKPLSANVEVRRVRK